MHGSDPHQPSKDVDGYLNYILTKPSKDMEGGWNNGWLFKLQTDYKVRPMQESWQTDNKEIKGGSWPITHAEHGPHAEHEPSQVVKRLTMWAQKYLIILCVIFLKQNKQQQNCHEPGC